MNKFETTNIKNCILNLIIFNNNSELEKNYNLGDLRIMNYTIRRKYSNNKNTAAAIMWVLCGC